MRLSNFRVSRALLVMLPALALLGAGRGGCAGVAVLSPAPDAVLLAPDVEVTLLLDPPLRPREAVSVDLEAGLDAPEGPEHRDLSGDLVLEAHGHIGRLHVSDLPPGRSRLRAWRDGPEPWPQPGRARGPRAAHPARATAERVLDRGGFFSDAQGPFAAGVRSASVPRTLADGSVRALRVFVWYPTRDAAAPDPALHAVPDAALPPDAAALPALVFSHGNCGRPTNYAILLSTLARAGWIAAAPTHPGNTADDPGCATIAAQIESFAQRPADLVAALDWLLAESAEPASPFAGAVDPDRIALAGHSFGALAALRTVPIEPRARSALLLAPVFAPVAPLVAPSLPLAVPAMLQVGEDDTTTPPATDARPLYGALAPPRFRVELAGAGHPVFEDSCATPAPGVCPDGGPALVARFALAFLGRYTADDLRWDALLAPAPGATLAADP
jgi:predicted dienelactone hydrolase